MKYSILFILAMLTSLSAISYVDVKVSEELTVHLPKGWVQNNIKNVQDEDEHDSISMLLHASKHKNGTFEDFIVSIGSENAPIASNPEEYPQFLLSNLIKDVENSLKSNGFTIKDNRITEETLNGFKVFTITISAEGSGLYGNTRTILMHSNSNDYYIAHNIFSPDYNVVSRQRPTTDLFSINQSFTTSRLEFGAWSFKEYEGGIMMYSLTDDEKQRITFNCMPNKRKVLAYREKKSPAYSQADYKKAYGLVDSINVMGWDIEYVDGFVQDENYAYILLPLPKDFAPKSDSKGRIILKGKDHVLELQTEYDLLKESLEVTFDNCLEGVP